MPALEWARQLTALEFELFSEIAPKELLGQGWSKKDKAVRASARARADRPFQWVSMWVASAVVAEAELKERAAAFAHFVEVATHCVELRNYNAAQEVSAGLALAAVHRLKVTKAALPAEAIAQYDALQALVSIDGNRKAYRHAPSLGDAAVHPVPGSLPHRSYLHRGRQQGRGRGRGWRRRPSTAAAERRGGADGGGDDEAHADQLGEAPSSTRR